MPLPDFSGIIDSIRSWFRTRRYHFVWILPLIGFVFGLTYSQKLAGGFVVGFGGFLLSLRILKAGLPDSSRRSSPYGETDFFDDALIALVAAMVKADGKVSAEEIDVVEKKLKAEYTSGDYKRAAQKLKIELDKTTLNIDDPASIIEVEFSASEKIQLLHLLVKIAVADGLLTTTENHLLQQITAKIGVPYRTLDSLLAMHRFRHEYTEYQYKKQKTTTTSQLENAYKILEITAAATNQEIKKAYKKLAIIHHPDKVAHLGENAQKTAAEKFKLIVGAYDLICKKRGIV
ncbi:MAG: TerB family tellurite resistance protein [Bacteroidetes bacterium]|nr:TerB family tellurite resistance protein [Bacteroidota bacterium]